MVRELELAFEPLTSGYRTGVRSDRGDLAGQGPSPEEPSLEGEIEGLYDEIIALVDEQTAKGPA